MLLMLPDLIAETGLLSFISRHHLGKHGLRLPLREVPAEGHDDAAPPRRSPTAATPTCRRRRGVLMVLLGEVQD